MQPAQAEGVGSSSSNVKKWGPIGAVAIVVRRIRTRETSVTA